MVLFPVIYQSILGLLFLSATVAFVWAIQGSRKNREAKNLRKKERLDHDMLDFLQSLYAEGQIDKDEYESRKRDLAA